MRWKVEILLFERATDINLEQKKINAPRIRKSIERRNRCVTAVERRNKVESGARMSNEPYYESVNWIIAQNGNDRPAGGRRRENGVRRPGNLEYLKLGESFA